MSKPHTDLVRLLRDLDTGILNHTNWLKAVHRGLVCGESTGIPIDITEGAYERCSFGQWYASAHASELNDSQVFQRIGKLHQKMHERLMSLIDEKKEKGFIEPDTYDDFMDLALEFKQEIRGLQFHIISQICLVDHLTGAWNRNGMQYRLAQEQERIARTGGHCSICMMDFDHFKEVNDVHGHLVGDQVLHNSMQFFSGKLRKYDSIFRFGGEEFLICLPNTRLAEARAIMDRLRIELAAIPIVLTQEQELHVTASFGVAELAPGQSFESVIQHADHALLSAKACGRNSVCAWGEED